MITSLSILIPTYNDICVGLVKELYKQAMVIDGLDFEIIVADDGSGINVVKKNLEINELHNCRYIVNKVNQGRAAIRNKLVCMAQQEWLLFIDADMAIQNKDYLRTYVSMDAPDVVYGGYVVNGDSKKLKGNLRFKYEKQYGGNSDDAKRNKHPYNDFHTSNFLVRRSVMLALPFDERIKRYGYEDVIWGNGLKEANIRIKHIDNPLSFEKFEDNALFMQKTLQGVVTLCEFREELKDNSNIIHTWERLRKGNVLGLFITVFSVFENAIKYNLIGNNPSVFLFKIYKLGLFSKLCTDY